MKVYDDHGNDAAEEMAGRLSSCTCALGRAARICSVETRKKPAQNQ